MAIDKRARELILTLAIRLGYDVKNITQLERQLIYGVNIDKPKPSSKDNTTKKSPKPVKKKRRPSFVDIPDDPPKKKKKKKKSKAP